MKGKCDVMDVLFYEHGAQCFVLLALSLNPVSFPEVNMMDEWVDVKSIFPFFFPQVLLLACAEDLECVPGFQQKVFYIEQPFEFTEDQAVLNRMLFSYITIVQKLELLMYSYHSCHLSESFFFLVHKVLNIALILSGFPCIDPIYLQTLICSMYWRWQNTINNHLGQYEYCEKLESSTLLKSKFSQIFFLIVFPIILQVRACLSTFRC